MLKFAGIIHKAPISPSGIYETIPFIYSLGCELALRSVDSMSGLQVRSMTLTNSKRALLEKVISALTTHSTIFLIAKPGKPRDQVGNYRPISLLNTPLKLLEQILLNRFQSWLEARMGSFQVGFRRNSHLSQHLTMIRLLTENSRRHKAAMRETYRSALEGAKR